VLSVNQNLLRYPLSVLLLCSLIGCQSYHSAIESFEGDIPENEVRALWIVRDEMKTRESIRSVVQFMKDCNLNTAIVQVRGRGDAFYDSQIAPRAAGVESGLDPLAEFIRLARPHGIEVHAWVNVFLVADSSSFENPLPGHLIQTRPEWFLKDKVQRSMLSYSARERKSARVEGAFLDPALPEVREYNIRVAAEIIKKYDIDGLHLDYIRYPWSRADTVYDFGTQSAIEHGETGLLFGPGVDDLRRRNVTEMVRMYSELIEEMKPGLILSAAVWPSRSKIEQNIFQDFPRWVEDGLVDYAFLMAYYRSIELFDSRLKDFYDPELNGRYVIGLGVFTAPEADVIDHQLRAARAIGSAGVCFFEAAWFLKRLSQNGPGEADKYALKKRFQELRQPGFTKN
jgi:uncharacterized lipoprotein YddW (UPF0748 family)